MYYYLFLNEHIENHDQKLIQFSNSDKYTDFLFLKSELNFKMLKTMVKTYVRSYKIIK